MDLLDPSSTDGHYLEQNEVDTMIQLAYGSSLVLPEHQEDESDWISQWNTVTQFTGSHYNLPRGSCGRRFITTLIEEIQLLVNGSFPSKRLIIFSSVILQRERSVSKTRDIIRSLNRRLDIKMRNLIFLFKKLVDVIELIILNVEGPTIRIMLKGSSQD